jgi:aspartyl-tRNA(Asn)/glutamyl-tRNA(Gln) amidotransferase subunit A
MYRLSRDQAFGPEVKRRIMLGTYALSAGYYDAYYLKAQKVRTLIARDFADAFIKVDAIVTPTAPTAAFKLGEKTDDPLAMYLADIYTVTADLAGVPGISVPCGNTRSGLPVGLQVLGRHFDEGTVLRVAQAVETLQG